MKRVFKTILGLMLVATVGVTVAACGKKADDGKTKIGILQLLDHNALDAARKGFTEELAKEGFKDGDKIKIDYMNAQGDQANLKTMSDRLKKDKNKLNLAIATPAAQAVLAADKNTPLLFTAITDPKNAGLVSDLNKPDKNATGVTDGVPVADQIKFMHKLFPKAKTVGLLFNAAEPNSMIQIKEARAAIKDLGLDVKEKTVSSTNDVEQTTTSLANQVDVIYIPADNVLTAAMATVGKVSEKTKIPVIPATIPMVDLGGVATIGIDYEDLGRQTAKMAVKIIKGEKVANMPIEKPAKISVKANPKFVKLFNIDQSLLKN